MPDNKANPQKGASSSKLGAGTAFDISVHRTGPRVTVSLMAADDYSSMKLYDHIVNSLRDGSLQLSVDRAQS